MPHVFSLLRDVLYDCLPRPRPPQHDDLEALFRDLDILPELVILGACESEMCGLALAKAGVSHVVAVKSGNGVSGATETLQYPSFPVISVILRNSA